KTIIIDIGDKHELKISKKAKRKEKEIVHEVEKVSEPGKYREVVGFSLAAFALLVVFNFINIGGQLFGTAADLEANVNQGIYGFVEGGKNAMDSNYGGAVGDFALAESGFEQAKEDLWFLGGELGVKEDIGGSAMSFLEAGEHLSKGASDFAQGLSALDGVPQLFLERNALKDVEVKGDSLTDKLKTALELFDSALVEVVAAKNLLNQASPSILPDKFRENYDMIMNRLDDLIVLLNELRERVPAIMHMLGDRYPHRYMVLFQNNTEARPTGGFIGSFLIIDVNDGYITKADFHDVYDFDGQLNEHIPAPEEIAELTTNWRLRDSNYSPDFEVSGKKAMWFLEKEGGPGVDTVIAINQSLLEDLLSITGPIEVEGLDAKLSSTNYNTVLTYIVESKLEGETSPKKILDRVIPAMQTKLTEEGLLKNIIAVIQKEVKHKNVLAYSKNVHMQRFFEEVGVSGKITQTPDDEDYFTLNAINIGGNKSDLYMDTTITHETFIQKDGSINNIATIKREHTWNPNVILDWKKQLDPFGYTDLPDWIQNILGRGNNKSVMKVFVPNGSILTDVIGMEKELVNIGLDEALNKTYFYFTTEVAPQSESQITLVYTLPYKLDLGTADEYRLTVQKQPGAIRDVKFIKRLHGDERVVNYRTYPEEIIYSEGDVIQYETSLIQDQHFASLWGSQLN
ncbi:DUF4012 domain-containing protein, partial [Patescibacteria group bacterium]